MPQIIGKIDKKKLAGYSPKKHQKKSKYVPSACSHEVENARRARRIS